MKNTELIEQLKKFLKAAYTKEKETAGYVGMGFFETATLKEQIQLVMVGLEMMGYPRLNDEKFKQLYEIAVKESKYKYQRGWVRPSVSLTTGEEKVLWLDDKRVI